MGPPTLDRSLTPRNSIIYYEPTIYVAQLGFSHTKASILSASAILVAVVGAFVSSAIVDRFGRRKLMLISVSSMAVCFACLSGLVSNSDNHAALKAAVFFLYLYLFVYVIGFLGVPFLYASEIAPTHLRGQVFSIATAVSWLFNFLVAEVTPVAFADVGWKYFIVYMSVNAAAIPIIYIFYPETSGRSLEEIDEIFAGSHGWFDVVSVAKELPKSCGTGGIAT